MQLPEQLKEYLHAFPAEHHDQLVQHFLLLGMYSFRVFQEQQKPLYISELQLLINEKKMSLSSSEEAKATTEATQIITASTLNSDNSIGKQQKTLNALLEAQSKQINTITTYACYPDWWGHDEHPGEKIKTRKQQILQNRGGSSWDIPQKHVDEGVQTNNSHIERLEAIKVRDEQLRLAARRRINPDTIGRENEKHAGFVNTPPKREINKTPKTEPKPKSVWMTINLEPPKKQRYSAKFTLKPSAKPQKTTATPSPPTQQPGFEKADFIQIAREFLQQKDFIQCMN